MWQTILKICTRFRINKRTTQNKKKLPSFSFSSVFYDLQSFVIMSVKAVSWLKEYLIESFLRWIRWIPNLKFCVLYFILGLVEVGIKQSTGDSVRAVGHQQHCELELSNKLSWEQTHRRWLRAKTCKKLKYVKALENTHPPSPAAHWTAAATHALHTPPHQDGLWPHPQTPWFKNKITLLINWWINQLAFPLKVSLPESKGHCVKAALHFTEEHAWRFHF